MVTICIQEVWAYNKTLEIPGFNFFSNTRSSSKGGGVGIFVCQNLKSNKLINCMHVGTLELLAVSITSQQQEAEYH